jgi:tetratricopeptide (TPR) repeat protein
MIITIAWLAAATATPAAPPSAEPAKLTLQQRFDQASTQAAEGQCQQAIPAFEAIEALPSFRENSLPAAMISVRKGQCLIRTGRPDEGETAIRKGLPVLQKQPDAFKQDMADALIALGDAALTRWDYAGARQTYEQAAALTGATHPAVMNVKLALATAFEGGEAPLRYIDAAIKAAETLPNVPSSRLAEYHGLRGRILLNQGRNAEAYEALKQALKLTGKLDLSVSLADVVLRGDLAVAAKLNGDTENARKYLAYTGAGRIQESPFTQALSMEAPVCGAETGLRPDDFAVVDFGINDDGTVFAARTAYTRGKADVAAQFAQAISAWTWDPKTIEKIPSFYRAAPRVEIRCTTQGQQVPELLTPLMNRFSAWAGPLLNLGNVQNKAELQLKLDANSDRKQGIPDQIASLALRATLLPASRARRYQLVREALTLAANGAAIPVEALNTLKVAEMDIRRKRDRETRIPKVSGDDMLALLKDPKFAEDALAADTIRLLAAEPRSATNTRPGNATALFGEVARDTRLPDRHPLRQAAQLRLANAAARQGDLASAQRYFAATGLTEEQCAYLGVTPALKRSGLNSTDFPDEALAYGFEGWVRLEFDIANDGNPASIRPLIAYPPLIFSEAAARSAKKQRYETSFRPEGSQACSAEHRTFVYRIN